MDTHSDGTPPLDDEIPTHSDGKNHHHVLPNKTKGTRLKNNTNKQEEQNSENTNFEGVNRDRNVSTRGKTKNKTTLFSEMNRFYQALTAEEKHAFDIEALKLLRPDESNGLAFERTLRCRYFEELLWVHTVRQKGEKTFTIPAEFQLASEPQEAIH